VIVFAEVERERAKDRLVGRSSRACKGSARSACSCSAAWSSHERSAVSADGIVVTSRDGGSLEDVVVLVAEHAIMERLEPSRTALSHGKRQRSGLMEATLLCRLAAGDEGAVVQWMGGHDLCPTLSCHETSSQSIRQQLAAQWWCLCDRRVLG
jgi:hypothetical protein